MRLLFLLGILFVQLQAHVPLQELSSVELRAELKKIKDHEKVLSKLSRYVQTANSVVWITKDEEHQNTTKRLICRFFKKLKQFEENDETKEKIKQLQRLRDEMQRQQDAHSGTIYTAA